MQENLQPISILNFLRLNGVNLAAPLSFSFAAFILSFVVNFFMTHILSTTLYGDTMLSITWISIMGSLVILGIDQSSRRFVTTYLANSNINEIHHFMRWGIKFITKSCILSFVAGLVCFVIFDPLDIHAFEPYVVAHSEWTSFYAFMFIITPIVGLTNWMSALLLCYKRTSASTFIQYLLTPIIMTVILAIIYNFLDIPLTPFEIRRTLFQTFILAFMITSLICIKLIPKFIRNLTQKTTVSKKSIEWRKSATKQVSNMLILNVLINLDFIMAGFFGKNSSSLGLYNIALTVTSILSIIPGAVFQYLVPELEVSVHHDVKIKVLQDYWNKTLFLNAVLLLLTTLLVNAYIDPILNFFGPDYLAAKPIVWVLLVGNMLSSMVGCPGTVLQYTGHVTKVLVNYASAIVIMVVLAFVFTPGFGLLGVAMARVIAWLCVGARNIWCVHKHLKLKALVIF